MNLENDPGRDGKKKVALILDLLFRKYRQEVQHGSPNQPLDKGAIEGIQVLRKITTGNIHHFAWGILLQGSGICTYSKLGDHMFSQEHGTIGGLYQEWEKFDNANYGNVSETVENLAETIRITHLHGIRFSKEEFIGSIVNVPVQKKLTEKEKLYKILKLENQDIGDKIDISKDWGDLAEVMRLVTEIARFAISDLATEKDQENRYIKVNEEDTYGNKKFHTLSFRNWVRDKSIALLTTYGFEKEIIERALIIVLKDEKRRKNSIYDDDWIRGMNIYDLGELIHISDGNHTPTLTRLLRLKKGEDIFMIISSLPTHELRIKDNEIKLIGCMRFTKNNSLTELLPIQEIDTYSQPPLLLEDILEETDRDKQKKLAKSLLIDGGVPQKLEDIWDRDDGDTLESLDAKKLEDNYPPFKPIGLDHYDPKKIKVRRNLMPIIVKNGYDTNWYIISKRGDESFAEAAYYKLPSGVYWRYICRIFGERPKMRFKRIGGKKVILRTKIPLPSRGYRIMSTTQAVSKKVRRNMNFELIEKKQRGAYTKIEWIVDEIVWDTYVRNYLEKYCLYEMEEVK